jgi:putative endonuclease
MAQHLDTGKQGEKIAQKYLLENGYEILVQNWLYKKYELDVVATKNGFLHVVEVKTRTQNYLTEPQAWVSLKKQQQLVKGANAYVLMHDIDLKVQFDIVTIIFYNNSIVVQHLQDAFYARI